MRLLRLAITLRTTFALRCRTAITFGTALFALLRATFTATGAVLLRTPLRLALLRTTLAFGTTLPALITLRLALAERARQLLGP